MAKRYITPVDKFLEKVPPIIAIILLLLPFILSLTSINLAAYYIIIIDIYFLYKSMAFAFQFAISLVKINNVENIDWLNKLKGLQNINVEITKLNEEFDFIKTLNINNYNDQDRYKVIKSRVIKTKPTNDLIKSSLLSNLVFIREKNKTLKFLKDEIINLKKLNSKSFFNFNDLQHIVIIPHIKEPEEILKLTLEYLKKQTFPTKQINIVLAAEEVDPNGVVISERLKEEYKNIFNNIWITNHVLTEGEARGKSANMAWAGKEVAKEIKKLGWDFEKVTLTSCDADSKLPDQYFSYLTYRYVTDTDSKYKYYNGALVLYNNIWRLPFYIRVKNSVSTIYNVGRLIRVDKLVPFSTYTTSFWLIDQIDYWTPWVTPEDFHMFFKALFKFEDKVETLPLYLKIMSDAADGDGHWETIKNNYKQERRWSWGVSDDGWILKNLLKNVGKYSFKVNYISLHVVFDHIFGPIASLLILVGGNIPPLINPNFTKGVLGARLPGVSSNILQLTLIFMVIIIILDFFLKPKPENNSPLRLLTRILEWFVQPLVGFFLTVLPGLEAHTRLLFGKYLEYYVTKKKS